MKTVAIIPARGGSKGIPSKNIVEVRGRALIDYTIDFAKESDLFDEVIVSSDSTEICEHVEKLGVRAIKRSDNLAQDNSLVIDAIKELIEVLSNEGHYPNHFFLLEPTSPFRSTEDLKAAMSALENGYDSVATFEEIDPSPGRLWKIEGDKISSLIEGSTPFMPRQMQPVGYKLTGQIYGFTSEVINQEKILFGRSFPVITTVEKSLDIDYKIDLILAAALIEYYEKNK